MGPNLLRVRDLQKEFVLHILNNKRVLAFRDITFDVPACSFVGIAGRSGSGKSSLLKCLFRTYLADGGSAIYQSAAGDLVDLTDAPDDSVLDLRATEIGYVSQFLRPLPRVTALDLAARPLLQRGVPRAEAHEVVSRYFERLSLPRDLWDGYPILFSGGEQQRVNLARALAARPRLLLLDEPTSALDSGLQLEVVRLLQEARADGVTMVGVMHDTALLDELSDEVITMQDGAIVERQAPRLALAQAAP